MGNVFVTLTIVGLINIAFRNCLSVETVLSGMRVVWKLSGRKPYNIATEEEGCFRRSEQQTFNLTTDSLDTSCWSELEQQFVHNIAEVCTCGYLELTGVSVRHLIDQIKLFWLTILSIWCCFLTLAPSFNFRLWSALFISVISRGCI